MCRMSESDKAKMPDHLKTADSTPLQSNQSRSDQAKQPGVFKSEQARRPTGWASMPSTSVFRAVNFELFVKPNKFVMACGVIIFTSCVSYIAYMNLTDDRRKTTYVTLDEDGGTTVRPRTSRWN